MIFVINKTGSVINGFMLGLFLLLLLFLAVVVHMWFGDSWPVMSLVVEGVFYLMLAVPLLSFWFWRKLILRLDISDDAVVYDIFWRKVKLFSRKLENVNIADLKVGPACKNTPHASNSIVFYEKGGRVILKPLLAGVFHVDETKLRGYVDAVQGKAGTLADADMKSIYREMVFNIGLRHCLTLVVFVEVTLAAMFFFCDDIGCRLWRGV